MEQYERGMPQRCDSDVHPLPLSDAQPFSSANGDVVDSIYDEKYWSDQVAALRRENADLALFWSGTTKAVDKLTVVATRSTATSWTF
eukprot:9125135-Karenia_brevis.AAC.1